MLSTSIDKKKRNTSGSRSVLLQTYNRNHEKPSQMIFLSNWNRIKLVKLWVYMNIPRKLKHRTVWTNQKEVVSILDIQKNQSKFHFKVRIMK